MATTKNITMKQFNGTDYDTLYPKTVAAQIDDVYSKNETYSKSQLYTQSQLYTKEQVLSDATKTLYGLGSSAVPDDVFFESVEANTGYIYITTKTSSGVVAGIPIMIDGVYAGKTGINGKARISVPFGAHTIKVVRPLDIASVTPNTFNINVTDVNAIVLESTCVLSTATEATISTSGNYGFSDRVEDFDVCAVGGGGGGGAINDADTSSSASGISAAGGGGGYVTNKLNILAKLFNLFSAVIGAGGIGGSTEGTSSGKKVSAGQEGGSSSITSIITNENITANGGKGGEASKNDKADGGDGGSGGGGAVASSFGRGSPVGGSGGQNGADGQTVSQIDGTGIGGTGQGTTTKPFADTTRTALSPGGGGAAVSYKGASLSNGTAQTGGSPGITGFNVSTLSATKGTVIGSGGGGAATKGKLATTHGADGVDGAILLRWRFKS